MVCALQRSHASSWCLVACLPLCCPLCSAAVRCLRCSPLQSSLLTVEYTTSAKAKVPKEDLKFGATTSDHMLEVDWDAVKGWHAPKIIPYQPLKLDPAASVLHYGLEVRTRAGSIGRWRSGWAESAQRSV